ncbi:hypothetical protein BDW22DRAFT_1348334 [Trametopsis cervina]|nr:hypothetical protein BDW22DRAFT_1348334 [Trametopsis cervina]
MAQDISTDCFRCAIFLSASCTTRTQVVKIAVRRISFVHRTTACSVYHYSPITRSPSLPEFASHTDGHHEAFYATFKYSSGGSTVVAEAQIVPLGSWTILTILHLPTMQNDPQDHLIYADASPISRVVFRQRGAIYATVMLERSSRCNICLEVWARLPGVRSLHMSSSARNTVASHVQPLSDDSLCARGSGGGVDIELFAVEQRGGSARTQSESVPGMALRTNKAARVRLQKPQEYQYLCVMRNGAGGVSIHPSIHTIQSRSKQPARSRMRTHVCVRPAEGRHLYLSAWHSAIKPIERTDGRTDGSYPSVPRPSRIAHRTTSTAQISPASQLIRGAGVPYVSYPTVNHLVYSPPRVLEIPDMQDSLLPVKPAPARLTPYVESSWILDPRSLTHTRTTLLLHLHLHLHHARRDGETPSSDHDREKSRGRAAPAPATEHASVDGPCFVLRCSVALLLIGWLANLMREPHWLAGGRCWIGTSADAMRAALGGRVEYAFQTDKGSMRRFAHSCSGARLRLASPRTVQYSKSRACTECHGSRAFTRLPPPPRATNRLSTDRIVSSRRLAYADGGKPKNVLGEAGYTSLTQPLRKQTHFHVHVQYSPAVRREQSGAVHREIVIVMSCKQNSPLFCMTVGVGWDVYHIISYRTARLDEEQTTPSVRPSVPSSLAAHGTAAKKIENEIKSARRFYPRADDRHPSWTGEPGRWVGSLVHSPPVRPRLDCSRSSGPPTMIMVFEIPSRLAPPWIFRAPEAWLLLSLPPALSFSRSFDQTDRVFGVGRCRWAAEAGWVGLVVILYLWAGDDGCTIARLHCLMARRSSETWPFGVGSSRVLCYPWVVILGEMRSSADGKGWGGELEEAFEGLSHCKYDRPHEHIEDECEGGRV